MNPLTKKLLAFYIIWEMLQLLFLILGDNFFGEIEINHLLGYVKEGYFYPFYDADYGIEYYDFTEFLFYSILPLAIYYVYQLLKDSFPKYERKVTSVVGKIIFSLLSAAILMSICSVLFVVVHFTIGGYLAIIAIAIGVLIRVLKYIWYRQDKNKSE